uniref:CSC1-like protein ERD4 n=1 Tax=Ananas comosus var. bracteatus TaxID=296719 RepID=A0A6V7NMV2_ANACO|nr:unnamed protein product [Ananas comosus var. bracteatus]
MDLSSFLTSLATSFVIFVVLMLVFVWLSRKPENAVVYYPNPILRGSDPWDGARRRTRSPVGWIAEAFSASEADVVAAGGVDAVVYLIFLATVMGILVFSGIVLLPALLPVAGTDHALVDASKNNKTAGNFTSIDKLAMGNVKNGSQRLWAFLLGVYWVSFVTYYILWRTYKHVSNLRAAAKSSPDAKPEEFAILVRDVPKPSPGQSIKDHVDSYFKALHPETFYRSMVVTDNKEANKIWKEIEANKKKLARAEAVYAESKSTSRPDGTRPTHRTGCLGLVGEKVDTINYCNEKINELLPKLEAEQKITLREKQQSAAIIFFNSRPAAASASQTIHAQNTNTWAVLEAPEPRQVLWTNLPKKLYERQLRQAVVYVIIVADQIEIKTVLEAYLPQIVLIVFLALLPMFLMILSKAEGLASESHAVRAAAGKYFYFVVFNVFIGVTLAGTLFSSLKSILNHPTQIVPLLGRSLPGNATFFLTFVALKFFVGYGLELSRLVPLIIFNLKKKFLCKTEAEVKEAWAPGDLGYATRVPNDMLIMTIVLCYSVIAPLIIPFGVVYFGLGWLVARNQVLRVYVPSYESNGRMWPHMHTRIIAALLVYQITMLGFIILKEFCYAPFLIPLIPITFIYAFICKNRFYLAFAHTPLEVASREIKETPNMESIYTAFIPLA